MFVKQFPIRSLLHLNVKATTPSTFYVILTWIYIIINVSDYSFEFKECDISEISMT